MKIDTRYCQRKILDLHGARGADWLAQLPALAADCAERWGLRLLPPFPVESYSFVTPAARHDGQPLVLKIGMPGLELTCQIEALRWWDGRGTCRLFESDAERGCLLMERVLPGDSLKIVTDDTAVTAIALETMRRLWQPAPPAHPFPSVVDWANDLRRLRARFAGGTGPLPAAAIERAERQFEALLGAESPSMLIHGDANWGNILRGTREPWLMINPKGVVGSPLWDVATFLNDPPGGLDGEEQRRLLGRRVSQAAETLGVERERVRAWGQAHSVLASVWTFEDHPGLGWKAGFAWAELYDQIGT